jgi:hypothetical protein
MMRRAVGSERSAWPMGPVLVGFMAASILVLAGCAEKGPAVVSSEYKPADDAPGSTPYPRQHSKQPAASLCRVRVAEVVDARHDGAAMGYIGGRVIHAADAAAWTRSGLISIGEDGHLALVDNPSPDGADVVVSAELLKAYMQTQTEAKAATVVVRVHYVRRGGASETQTYRGSDTSLNWANGDGETEHALNRAMAQVLAAVRLDIYKQCELVETGAGAGKP